MKKCFKIMFIVLFITGVGIVWVSTSARAYSPLAKAESVAFDQNTSGAQPAGEQKGDPDDLEQRPAEQVYKNVQVLKGLSKEEFDGTMAFISLSLGVRCNFCHVQVPNSPKLILEKDDKAQKEIARDMIKMVRGLEKGSVSHNSVNCYTCHRGQIKPQAAPSIAKSIPPKAASGPTLIKADASMPTVDQILDRYVEALGGKAALEHVSSRMFKASRSLNGGEPISMTIYEKAPNKSLAVTTTPDNIFYDGFNGIGHWSANEKGPPNKHHIQIALARRDGDFYKPIRLRQMFVKMTLIGKEKIGDRELYIIESIPLDPNPEKLFFDVKTGLLVRRYREYRTDLGPIPSLTEYEDYRDVEGVKIPFVIRQSTNSNIVTLTISEAKLNIAIEDDRFEAPPITVRTSN